MVVEVPLCRECAVGINPVDTVWVRRNQRLVGARWNYSWRNPLDGPDRNCVGLPRREANPRANARARCGVRGDPGRGGDLEYGWRGQWSEC